MNRILLLLISIYFISNQYLLSQDIDTTKVNKIIQAEDKIDSLRLIMKNLQSEINRLKINMVGKSNIDYLVKQFEEEESLNIPEDQKSSHRRLDALLKIINNRPGQIRLNGGAVSVIQTLLNNRKATGVGIIDLFTTTSFGKGSLFFINFQAIGGNGLDGEISPILPIDANSGSTQTVEGYDVLQIAEAWANFSLFEENLDVTIGKIDLTNYIDNNNFANDEYSQFLHSGFVNGGNLNFLSQTAGFRMRTTLFDKLFLQFIVSKENNTGKGIFSNLIKAGSFGFKILTSDDFENNFRSYFYLSDLADNTLGYGISFDQKIYNSLGLFFRWGKNDNKYSVFTNVKNSWSIGGSYQSKLFKNNLKFGFAYGVNYVFDKYLNNEKVIELFSRYMVNKWVNISFHLQNIRNIGGTVKQNTILSFRTHIYF